MGRKGNHLLLIALLGFILIGCGRSGQEFLPENAQEPEKIEVVSFVEGKHAREEGYEAAFNTYYATEAGVEFHVIINLYEETVAKKLLKIVAGDYQVLKTAGAEDCGAVKVYAVQVTVAGKPQVTGNSVFCTTADIESGAYRECLTAACYQNISYWKTVGLSAYLFDDAMTNDSEKMKVFYEIPENLSVLSMFPVFFSETFAEEKTLEMAEKTATALTKYMVEQIGVTEFLRTKELAKYSKGWCESLGLEVSAMTFPEDDLHLMKYSSSDKYPVVLEYDNFTFYLKPVDWITTAEEAYNILLCVLEGYENIWTELEISDSEAYALLREKINTPMHIYFQNESENISHATRDKQIYLSNAYAACHEMLHLLLSVDDEEMLWYEEGVNAFLTYETELFYMNAEKKEPLFQLLTQGKIYQEASEENQKFLDCVAEYYMMYAPLPKKLEEMKFLTFYLAVGKTTLKYPEMPTELTMAVKSIEERKYQVGTNSEKAIQSIDMKVGNYLTYPEATVCIEYLAEKYGLETVITVARDISLFEETFGDMETVIAEVQASIEPID